MWHVRFLYVMHTFVIIITIQIWHKASSLTICMTLIFLCQIAVLSTLLSVGIFSLFANSFKYNWHFLLHTFIWYIAFKCGHMFSWWEIMIKRQKKSLKDKVSWLKNISFPAIVSVANFIQAQLIKSEQKVHIAQWDNLRILLSLRIYVKSILT